MLLLIITLGVSATSTDTLNAVTMVSYEQRWLDHEGTLALKNNTNKDIHHVSFRITYLDMDGNPLDYEDYSKKTSIAPGMTKKVNIPAYECDRHYSYYLSEAVPGNPHKFKIRFELTGFDAPKKASGNRITVTPKDTINAVTMIPDEQRDNELDKAPEYSRYTDEYSSEGETRHNGFEIILSLVAFLLIMSLYWGSYLLVALMANNRKRSTALWVLISICATPWLAIFLLLCIGKSSDSK